MKYSHSRVYRDADVINKTARATEVISPLPTPIAQEIILDEEVGALNILVPEIIQNTNEVIHVRKFKNILPSWWELTKKLITADLW